MMKTLIIAVTALIVLPVLTEIRLSNADAAICETPDEALEHHGVTDLDDWRILDAERHMNLRALLWESMGEEYFIMTESGYSDQVLYHLCRNPYDLVYIAFTREGCTLSLAHAPCGFLKPVVGTGI